MKLAAEILKYFPFGGLQRDFLRILEEAHRRGHSVTVFTRSWTGPRPDWINLRILAPHALTNHGGAVKFFRELKKALAEDPHDLLLGMSRGPGLDVYFAGDNCFAAEQKRKHGKLWNSASRRIRIFSRFERDVFSPDSKTEILYLVGAQLAEYGAVYGTPAGRMRLIPPGMNPECMRPPDAQDRRAALRKKWGVPEDCVLLLTVGANLKLKGADRVIRAVAAMPEALRRKIRLRFVGPGTDELERLACRTDADIAFFGFQEKILDFYLASDLLVHPARSEAAGSVIIEAIASGLPVLCTDNCGFHTFVKESGGGWVVSGDFHQDELNAALESLLTHRKKLSELSALAAEYARHTDLTGRAPAAVDLLEEVFHAKHSAS